MVHPRDLEAGASARSRVIFLAFVLIGRSNMFNAPRRMNGPPLASSAFLTPSSTTNGTYADPLASSMPNPGGAPFGEGEVDPWSSAPSPAPSGTPRRDLVDDGDTPVPPAASSLGIPGKEGLNALISMSRFTSGSLAQSSFRRSASTLSIFIGSTGSVRFG